jgi:ribosomal protein S18 acetylase RimI-like enzyme
MIRPTRSDDIDTILEIAAAIAFEPHELEQLSTMLANYFGSTDQDGRFWLTDDDHGPVGVAYCEPERMTDQTWNLLLIAIHPDHQGKGRGTALLRHVEQTLAGQGGRLLLVETSGIPDFDGARSFYRQCGYEEEARIRDFYAFGDDKIVYRRQLTCP